MNHIPKKWPAVIVMLLPLILSGCIHWLGTNLGSSDSDPPIIDPPRNPQVPIIYFFREPNYTGAGRIHILKIDGKEIGTLTDDNYYRIELWPGEYHLAVYLPAESFLGIVSPPASIILQLTIRPANAASTTFYRYTDGRGIARIDPVDPGLLIRLKETRPFLKVLNRRDTAQVKSLFDTRYDGPAKKDNAHGIGTLTWEDGGLFRGRFIYGEIADEGVFFTPSGRIYMGPTRKGRPIGPGVWMTPDLQIDYAGNFLDEVPHGTGIRSGPDGPEFCKYQEGEDITKTLKQLTQEAIEADHQLAVAKANQEDENSSDMAGQHKVDHFSEAYYERRLAEIMADNQMRIEEKRAWCRDEFKLERRLCICAPFATDFNTWKGCQSR